MTGRPKVPTPAQRARTIAARSGEAVLMPSVHDTVRIQPHLHHVHADATATVLLPDRHPLLSAAWSSPRGAISVMLELTDQAPVELREPVRGLLWITGLLSALSDQQGRERAISVAEHNPDPRLLDVGNGYSVLRLDPATLVLADGEGSESLNTDEFLAAQADPFHEYEAQWLRHLECAHRDVVGQLSRHLPDRLRGGRVRPLGIDRLGLRLRVEAADADHDVRLAFSHSVDTAEQLATELRTLLGCPFLAHAR